MIRGQVLQLLVAAMDADRSMMLSDAEINSLVVNIEGVRGVRVNAVHFRDCIVEHGRSIEGLMHVTKHLLQDRPSNSGTQLFHFTTTAELT
jgi:hypothetical protein